MKHKESFTLCTEALASLFRKCPRMSKKDSGRHETPEVIECYEGLYCRALEYEMRIMIAALLHSTVTFFSFPRYLFCNLHFP
jgi:hypothetical protein